MIRLFKKAKKGSIGENKTGKYLKYAIGEIILVVIGILIALSINNWNENQKSIRKGKEILKDIKENLEFNSSRFAKDIEVTKDVIMSIDIVVDNVTRVKVYNDSLGKHLRRVTYWETSRWKSSGYEALISNGVEIIKSKELQEEIINLYEIVYPEIAEYTRLSEGNFPIILPRWLELVERESSNFTSFYDHESKPINYQAILRSDLFRSILTFLRSQRVVDIELRRKTIQKNTEIIDLIESELDQ